MKAETEKRVIDFLKHIENKFQGFPITCKEAKELREEVQRELKEMEK